MDSRCCAHKYIYGDELVDDRPISVKRERERERARARARESERAREREKERERSEKTCLQTSKTGIQEVLLD